MGVGERIELIPFRRDAMATTRAPKKILHRVWMTVGTPLLIPSGAKKGVQFELAGDDGKIGDLLITGAQIVFRSKGGRWVPHTFQDVAAKLG
jgi:hypothetical protein